MLTAALLLLAGQSAFASVTAYAPGQGAVNSVSVNIDVRASVRARCGFAEGAAPTGSISQPDFDQHGFQGAFDIRLNCSGAARVAVSSRNGGLAGPAAPRPGFASLSSYQVELLLVGDDGTRAEARCDSSLLTGPGLCPMGGAANGSTGLRLAAASTGANGSYLRVSAPPRSGGDPLEPGRYADTLSITVSIAP